MSAGNFRKGPPAYHLVGERLSRIAHTLFCHSHTLPCGVSARDLMRYTIYEDPLTHKFAFLPLPIRFVVGDTLPIAGTDRWFGSRAEAIAALPELFNRDECEPGVALDDETAQIDDGPDSADTSKHGHH